MRITMKGGVWKNSEDEILKAAVMKYGLNNWSRVASLLVRKSTKQCKSRWYEWLDPSVKKTEWTREEEEKLLHLAKLFPNQWRTIAPIVGRTAHQCLEHYDRLLDQAQGRSEEDRSNDPRRLRPGEIDPHPETKPSRADAVDMDDDEKEMLAEARARLANTRGKKAKRKAREKQLEEARRLAALQKRRELKAAGINVGRWRRRNQAIDYAREVVFEQQPPKGFYAIGPEENPVVAKGAANLNLQQIEGERRVDEERRLRKEDTRKLKRLMDENLPEAIRALEKINEPPSFRKRTKLTLPAPQLTDAELDDILNIGKDGAAMGSAAFGEEHSNLLLTSAATIGPTRQLQQFTPMRTPAVENTILLEAQNAVARTMAPTPLEGGEAPVLHDVVSGVGATPSHTVSRTPHPFALSHGAKDWGVGRSVAESTPFSVVRGSTVPATPFSCRGDSAAPGSSVGAEKLSPRGLQDDVSSNAMLKLQVRSSLANLPLPQNEIEVTLPEAQDAARMEEEDQEAAPLEDDADDVERRRLKELEKERLCQFKRESQVIQQNLPRPVVVDAAVVQPSGYTEMFTGDDGVLFDEAERYINEEMISLLKHDAITHPLPIKGLRLPQDVKDLEPFELTEIQAAQHLVQQETTEVQQATGQALDYTTSAELRQVWEDVAAREFLYDPATSLYVDEALLPHDARLEALKRRYEDMKSHLVKDAQKARKCESKIETLTKGYGLKSKAYLKSIEELWLDTLTRQSNINAFLALEQREQTALRSRTEELEQLVKEQKAYQDQLQLRYAALVGEREKLRSRMASATNGHFCATAAVAR